MTPQDTAAATAEAITTIGSHFMLDPATYGRGIELGFSGLDFYVTGRGGVLGAVDADVVTAAFVFFAPAHIRTNWEAGCKVMAPQEAAAAFIAAGHDWGRAKLAGAVDCARLAALARKAAQGASPAAAPLFAAWRAQPEPDDAPAQALHHLNVLRELRGGMHGAAVVAQGLSPLEAVLVKGPHMAPVFGWQEPYPDVTGARAAWDAAEAATNRAMATAFEALDDAERAELTELANAAHQATTG